MTGTDLLSGLREAEYALWWAMRDTLQADPDAMNGIYPALCVSLDEIETHVSAIRTLVRSSQDTSRRSA